MNGFIGRKEELKVLQDAFRSTQSAFIPIYGRRRVGKSELILQFLKDKKGIYYCGKKAQARIQIREFLQDAALILEEPLLSDFAAEDWKSALSAALSKWRNKHKCILVFDEFQWMVEHSPELPSVIQELWDREWRKNGRILLIVCGSFVGFMERTLLGKTSPLFGRRTAQIFLKPFNYRESAEFHPSYSLEDKARTYFICGGIPLYLKYFSPALSVEMNILENLLNQYAPLFQEPDFLLREELREIENYYAILMTVASRSTTNKEISQKTGIDTRALHYYLKQILELGYISRRFPLTGKPPSPRDVRYILDDPLLRFWFRFVYPSTSYIIQMGGERAFKDRIAPELESYFGLCFERLCREALPYLYEKEGVKASFEIGEYWDKSIQIDVIGLRNDNWTDICECKWGIVRSSGEVERDLEQKISIYPNPRNTTLCRRIFTRKPVPIKNLKHTNARWHRLKDLYPEPHSSK